jgi:hypothetical protein
VQDVRERSAEGRSRSESVLQGESISRLSRVGPEIDRAATNKVAMTVALRETERPKPKKSVVSQKSRPMRLVFITYFISLCSRELVE